MVKFRAYKSTIMPGMRIALNPSKVFLSDYSSMLPNYVRGQRNHKLIWSEELKHAFYALRDAVAECPKLYFINEEWDVGLETDASDYGIGGFLFQINPNSLEKIPIQFVSKSLTGPQLRWSTPEKEMYALYYTVKKLEYI